MQRELDPADSPSTEASELDKKRAKKRAKMERYRANVRVRRDHVQDPLHTPSVAKSEKSPPERAPPFPVKEHIMAVIASPEPLSKETQLDLAESVDLIFKAASDLRYPPGMASQATCRRQRLPRSTTPSVCGELSRTSSVSGTLQASRSLSLEISTAPVTPASRKKASAATRML